MTASTTTYWPRIFLLWACGVVAAMQFAKIAVAFVVLQAHYQVSQTDMGVVLSILGLVAVVLGATIGVVAPLIGYRRLLLLGLGLGAAMSAWQSLLPPYAWMLVTRVLEGASHLAVVVAAPTLLAAQCAPAQRSVAMGLWSTFVGVAFAASAAVGSPLLARFGVDSLLLAHGLGMAALAGAVAWSLPAQPATASARRWPDASSLVAQHLEIYRHFNTAVPGLCFFFYTVLGVALLTFVPQLGGAQRMVLALVLPLAVMAGTFSAGWLTQHFMSPLQLVRAAFSGVALSAVALWAGSGHPALFLPSAALLMFLAGLSGGASFGLVPYLNQDSAMQARANGAVAQLGNLGSSSGPPLFAAAISTLGLVGLVLPLFALAALGAALAAWALRRQVLPGKCAAD